MTTLRLMGGATHKEVASIPASGLGLAAGYTTGTPDVMWTAADWARFPGQVHVTIDQGYGPHDPDADIRDVEPGAWTPEAAVREPWNAPRPTIYCDRNDLPRVLAAGWHGDLALAIPEPEPELPPVVPGCNVVTVQFKFFPTWQLWVVFDEFWPLRPPPVPGPGHRIIASGIHTVGQIAGRESRTVPELITSTLIKQRENDRGELDPGQRALLDRLTNVHPLPGTVFWT